MGYFERGIEQVGGRRVLLALGGFYVAIAASFPVTPAVGDRTVNDVVMISVLIGASGLALAYGGYRLSQRDIRSDLYPVVAGWCVRAIVVMVGILLFIAFVAYLNDPLANFLILPALASVAGLGMGIHDGQAKTRAVDAEEYSQELERYKTLVETVNDGIFVADSDNHFTLVNDAYCELVGYDREELLGAHASLVADDQREDAKGIIEEVERDLAAGTPTSYESALQTASGETLEAEWTVAPLPAPDGGEPDRAVVVRDVTERNERERQLEAQNERLESFASMLAHELRNPVTIGQIYSQQLPDKADGEAVKYVTEAFDRIEEMIDVMLVLTRGRKAVGEASSVEFADVVEDAWEDIDAPDADLNIELGQTIEAEETYLRHMVRNLLENAVEHGGSDVTVTVGELPDGFYVADDGPGIPPDERKAVFDEGYTTAADNGGTGLGLAFVQKLAEVYDWNLAVTESAAGGARFEFRNVS